MVDLEATNRIQPDICTHFWIRDVTDAFHSWVILFKAFFVTFCMSWMIVQIVRALLSLHWMNIKAHLGQQYFTILMQHVYMRIHTCMNTSAHTFLQKNYRNFQGHKHTKLLYGMHIRTLFLFPSHFRFVYCSYAYCASTTLFLPTSHFTYIPLYIIPFHLFHLTMLH